MDARGARELVTTIEHTADLGLEIRAPSLGALYAAALLGLTDVMVEGAAVKPREGRELELEADDRSLLLVRLLGEVLYLFDTDGWLAAAAEVTLRPSGCGLQARLRGETFDAARHPFRTQVKAVTYHGLVLHEEPGRFLARVILDL